MKRKSRILASLRLSEFKDGLGVGHRKSFGVNLGSCVAHSLAQPRLSRSRKGELTGDAALQDRRRSTMVPLLQSVASVQTDECNAHRHALQFDCSYSRDKAHFILKQSALNDPLSVALRRWDLCVLDEN